MLFLQNAEDFSKAINITKAIFFDRMRAIQQKEESRVRKFPHLVIPVLTIFLGITMFSLASAKSADENKAEGEAFLAENSKKSDVTVTATGLQYQVLKQGEGAKPSASDNVTVHYEGTTIDGNVFDSSYKRGDPATFPLNRVIAGWTEGVQLMQEGSKFRFYIPAELAYGARGAGRDIGPNAALIFDVELIKIQ